MQNYTDSQWTWLGDSWYRMHRFRSAASAIKGLTAEILVSYLPCRFLRAHCHAVRLQYLDHDRSHLLWTLTVIFAIRHGTTHDVRRHPEHLRPNFFHGAARYGPGGACAWLCDCWPCIAPASPIELLVLAPSNFRSLLYILHHTILSLGLSLIPSCTSVLEISDILGHCSWFSRGPSYERRTRPRGCEMGEVILLTKQNQFGVRCGAQRLTHLHSRPSLLCCLLFSRHFNDPLPGDSLLHDLTTLCSSNSSLVQYSLSANHLRASGDRVSSLRSASLPFLNRTAWRSLTLCKVYPPKCFLRSAARYHCSLQRPGWGLRAVAMYHSKMMYVSHYFCPSGVHLLLASVNAVVIHGLSYHGGYSKPLFHTLILPIVCYVIVRFMFDSNQLRCPWEQRQTACWSCCCSFPCP